VPTLFACGGKLIVAIAATWAVGASLYIVSVPVSVGGVTKTMSDVLSWPVGKKRSSGKTTLI